MEIKSKLPNVGTTIFSVMTNLAIEHNAINLSQGFPDFNVNPDLISLIEKYMRQGFNQYAPMQGILQLRKKISGEVKELYGAEYDPLTEITVTSGATEALFSAITAVVRQGDEAIVFEPAYDSYIPAIELCGGVPINIKMTYPDYRIDWNMVNDAITSKTKLIILNSPHNPTGSILNSNDINALKEIISKNDIFIVSDEVYEHIIFDNLKHESMSRYPELAGKSFVISSFGKTYHATGWKIGYCLAPEAMSREFHKVHQYVTYATNTPIQYAYADYMENKNAYTGLSMFYEKKRDLFLSHLNNSKFKIIPCHGTYFQMLDYSEISSEPDTDFSKKLITKPGIASIPPSVFYRGRDDHRVLRFCFAKKDETLKEAADKLCRI